MDTINTRIHQKLISDNDLVSDAFINLSEVVTGNLLFDLFSEKRARSSMFALSAVLEYYGIRKKINLADTVTDPLDQINNVIRPEGIMQRQVSLTTEWYKDAFGAMIGTLTDDTVVALIPAKGGYCWVNSITGEKVSISRKNSDRVNPDAICFYAPLPEGRLTFRQLVAHIRRSVTVADIVKIAVFSFLVTLLSMITPAITQYIYSQLAPQYSLTPLLITFVLLVSASTSVFVLNIGKSICLSALNIKTDASISSALMMRVLNLPAPFFRKMPSGEVHARIESASDLCSTLLNTVLSGVLTILMSLIYLIQIFSFTPSLVLPAVIAMAVMLIFTLTATLVQAGVVRRQMKYYADESSFLFSTLNGIQRIRLSGAENRFFGKWAEKDVENAMLQYHPPFVIRYYAPITMLISMLSTALLYYIAYKNMVPGAQYLAFNASYGLLSGAFLSLNGLAMSAARIKPVLEFIRPILEERSEINRQQKTITHLSGSIEINQVTFTYKTGSTPILNRFSLKVAPGEYVAIVGHSGSGKSTLLRLLLGFEKPQQGNISYDSIDISAIDSKSLRQHIGCVMQNAGLFTGSIRSNLSITAPYATEEDLWEAAEIAGIAEDIRRMPMGMDTMVTEGMGSVSGGQKQRLIIARAIVSKPEILFLDEATSALDNNTQKIVTDSLAALHCTRVVIAHRLSTVQNCDRIVMIGEGRILESGTYDELMEKNGAFAAMVRRQQI